MGVDYSCLFEIRLLGGYLSYNKFRMVPPLIFSTMKKILLLIALTFVTSVSFAQKIKKKEVDKFTKNLTIETSKESLYSVNFMASGFIYKFDFCIRKVGDSYAMPANILLRDIEKYDEKSGVTFLLDNDDTVELITNYTGIGATKFGQGYFFETSFSLSNDDVNKLKEHKITNVRVNYMGGHYDRELKSKKQELVMKCLELVDKEH